MPDQQLEKDLHFPRGGINLSQAFSRQPNVPITLAQLPQVASQEGIQTTTTPLAQPSNEVDYVRTTPIATNVRGFEPVTGRMRGGSRCGLSKWVPNLVSGSRFIIQDLQQLILSGAAALAGATSRILPGGVIQPSYGGRQLEPSQQGRVVTVLAVAQGNIYWAAPGSSSWTPAINGTTNVTPLNASGLVSSAQNNQKMYYVDGVSYVVYQPKSNTASSWGLIVSQTTQDLNGFPITGTLPFDADKNACRLIATWRGRTLISGLLGQGNNIFMSAVNDPNNWDYSPGSTAPTQAVDLSAAPQGSVGDIVTTMIPYNDDILVIGCNHSIYVLRGDPMAGGQLDLVTATVGIAWNQPWCMDPYGNIFFFSNTGGVYVYQPGGGAPQRISQPIEQLVDGIDTGQTSIRLLWSDKFQGFHLFMTNLIKPTVQQHLFFEQRTNGWYQDQYGSTNYDPICCCTSDGNVGQDRVPLIGSWDGYVRLVDPSTATDDGTPFASQVLIGPLLTPVADAMLVKSLQAIMGETSGSVTYQIFLGVTAEAALSSQPVMTGTWTASRNFTIPIRREGYAVYVGITSTNPWTMEEIKVMMATKGKVMRRGAGR